MHPVPLTAIALALLVAAVPTAAGVINAPGEYPASVAVDSSLLPEPLPGVPQLGPDVYNGSVAVEARNFGYAVRFRGTSADGHALEIRSRFAHGWFGLTLATLVVDGTIVQDAIVGLDGASLISLDLEGVGFVNGNPSRVKARLGAGPSLKDFDVLPL